MAFSFSVGSITKLAEVHPDPKKLCLRALELTPFDFAVIQGLRTPDQQQADIAKGLSETQHSRHLHGFAIDFMAFVAGKACWIDNVDEAGQPDLHPYRAIADAFRQAAVELSIPIEWGGAWGARLDKALSADAAYTAYIAARQAASATPFLDLDHIQLDPITYPDP